MNSEDINNYIKSTATQSHYTLYRKKYKSQKVKYEEVLYDKSTQPYMCMNKKICSHKWKHI